MSVLNADLTVGEAVAGNVGTICRLELPGVRARLSLLGCRRDDRPVGTTVDQPLGAIIRIDGVEKIVAAFKIAGESGVYFGPALPFPVGLFS